MGHAPVFQPGLVEQIPQKKHRIFFLKKGLKAGHYGMVL
jgi:hypothetical protein